MNKILTYLALVLKNTILLICLGLDIIGIIVTYFSNLEIPSYVFYSLLVIGFVFANYRIYIENSPEINISVSPLRQFHFKSRACGENRIDLMINYNLFINNFGNNVGIVEDIIVELVKFSEIKDKFLLSKVNVKFSEYFIAEEEIFTPLEFMKHQKEAKYPIVLEPKKTLNKILILYLEIAGTNREDYLNTLNWLNDFEFDLLVSTRNNNIKKQEKYKIVLPIKELNDFRIQQEKSEEELKAFFDSLDS